MKLFLSDWQIAYRNAPAGIIIDDLSEEFIPIIRDSYAAADPFLFNKDHKKYLFAEIMIDKKCPGKIAYSEWEKDHFGDWHVIIEEPYHLSYPNVFEYNGEVYLVPESNESGEVYVYRAIEFPSSWQKCFTFIKGKKCVDTTFLEFQGKHYMFTYEIEPAENKKLWIYEISESGQIKLIDNNPFSTDESVARPVEALLENVVSE